MAAEMQVETSTLKFLKDLDRNNNRDWFQANKKRFDAAQDNIAALTGYLTGEIGKFDDAVATLDTKAGVFRIYRDIRFSKDKRPYKTNLGAYIAPGGRRSMLPGYYIHIQPGQSFIAGGKHMPDGVELQKIRAAIASNTDEFLKIISKKRFVEQFGGMNGERLKSAPKGFDPEHPAIEYLKLKQFTVHCQLGNDKVVTSSEYPKLVVKAAKEMYPLISFLRNALA